MSDSNLSSYQKRKRAELFNAIETTRPVLPEEKLKMLDDFIEKNEAVVKEVEKEKNIMADNPIKESDLASQTISYANPFGGDDTNSKVQQEHSVRKVGEVNITQIQPEQRQVLQEDVRESIDQGVEVSVNNVAEVELRKDEVAVQKEIIEAPIQNIQNEPVINMHESIGEVNEDLADESVSASNIDVAGAVDELSPAQKVVPEKPIVNAEELLKEQRKKLEEELPELTESQKRLIIEQEKLKRKNKPNAILSFFMKILSVIWAEINRIEVVKKFMVEYNSNVALAKENALENYSTFSKTDSIKLGMEMIVDKYLNPSEQAKNKAFIDKQVDERYSLKLFKQGFVVSAIFISVLLLFGLYENIADNIIPITFLREVLFIIPFTLFAFIVYKFHNKIYLKSLFPLTAMTAGIFGLVVAMIFIINSYIFVTVLSLALAVVLIYFGFTRLDLDLKKLSKEFSFEDKDKQCPTCGKLVPKGESYCYNCEREVY